VNRRTFLRSSAVLSAFAPAALRAAEPKAAAPAAAKPRRAHKKGFMFGTFGAQAARTLSVEQRFKLLREAGFHGVEVASAMNQQEVLAARDAAGLEIPSVVIATHWTHPLSSPNPTMRQTGLDGLRQGLRDAKAYGASSVLLVPGVVNKDISYADCYTRSIEEIKKAIPLAEELGVVIAIENVWNGFLLSPLEAVAYVDSFKTPIVRWHFDVGNVVNMGWPDQWARLLGPRISKIHVKEYSRKIRDEKGPFAGFRAELLTGDSDWPAVMAALDSVGYTAGWLITEQSRATHPNLSDAEWLSHLNSKLDQIIAA
jgi:L-ribulose-5-phosphate 3-epimerase